MKTYAAIYKDNKIRENSSSGGIFSALAEKFDVVYGVAMTDDCYGAKMIRVEGDISPLRGSKYFQAKVGDAFKRVKKDLEEGRKVLFSGTGCQINGLALFLGKDYSNLFLLDIICHGTPSPKLWREYVSYQEKKHGKLESVNFRCKDDSWIDFGMKENQLHISKDTDFFMRMFLRDYCLRPACYECQAKRYRKADMTIADFWGIQAVAPEMNDGRGTSLVITRTEKGQELFEGIKSELKWKEVSYEEGVKGNPSEYKSVARPQQRDTFFEDLDKLSFDEMAKKYAADRKVPFKRRVVNKIKRTIKKILRGGGGLKNTQMPTMASSSHSRSNSDYGMLLTFKK